MAEKIKGGDGKVVDIKGGRPAPKGSPPATPPHSRLAPGDNGPSDDDIRMFTHGMLKLNERRAALNAEVSSYRKTARALGIELGIIDRRIKMLEWTPQEVIEAHQKEIRYAEAMGQPVGSQLELFGGEETPEPVRESLRWRGQGRIDGLAGRGDATEWPVGCPPEHRQRYGEGWTEGQKETQAAFLRRHEGVKSSPAGPAA